MNLSCNKAVATPGSGETLTITCFTCGMPSSREWAQKIRSRPTNSLQPYYPFLLQVHPPLGSGLREDGSTYVCAFCHASLESQWKNYERQQPNGVPPMNRKYNLYKFICGVCGVETYRKRVRTLPFQEFPFLANQRPAGSLTLGNNPLAIVCLDCSETLWAQSAEYDRWGLPIHKRMFNWMARPPPPEDSVEATVARLPSGETQLPRCPPIEPVLPSRSKDVTPFETLSSISKNKARNGKLDSATGDNEPSVPSRKSSLSVTTSSSADGNAHSQPPVVTVAPMAAHNSPSQKKETVTSPLGYGSSFKYDVSHNGIPAVPLGYPGFGRPSSYPSPYGSFSWSARDTMMGERFGYGGLDGLPTSQAWHWMPPSSMLPYSAHGSPYANRVYTSEHLYPSNAVHVSQIPSQHIEVNINQGLKVPSRNSSPNTSSSVSPVDRNGNLDFTPSARTKLNGASHRYGSPDEDECSTRPSFNGRSKYKDVTMTKRLTKAQLPDSENSSSSSVACEDISHGENEQSPDTNSQNEKDAQRNGTTEIKSKRLNRKDSEHMRDPQNQSQQREKHQVKSRRLSVDQCSVSSSSAVAVSKSDPSRSPKAKHSPSPEKDLDSRKFLSEPLKKRNGSILPSATTSESQSSASDKSAFSKKFMIAYLCKSDLGNSEHQMDSSDSSGRRSVIVTTPKIDEKATANNKRKISNADKRSSVEEPARKFHRPAQESGRQCLATSENQHGHSTCPPVPNSSLDEEVVETREPEITEEFVQGYAEKLVSEYKRAIRQEKLRKRKLEADQENFLHSVGLITRQKRSELELDYLIRRSNRHTLLPLKLRPNSPLKSDDNKELNNVLLQVAFDDPSLKTLSVDKEEVKFLQNLDLKPANPSEKQIREKSWRFMLLERMKRSKRSLHLQGIPKPWTNSDIKFDLCPKFAFPKALEQIPSAQVGISMPSKRMEANSSITAVTACEKPGSTSHETEGRDNSDRKSAATFPSKVASAPVQAYCVVQPVISYPKYIPRNVTQVKADEPKPSNEEDAECKTSSRNTKATLAEVAVALETPLGQIQKEVPAAFVPSANDKNDALILKVPHVVVGLKGRDPESNGHGVTNGHSCSPPPEIPVTLETMLKDHALHNERFLKQIDELLASIPANNSKQDKVKKDLPITLEDWKKLKVFIKSQQQEFRSLDEKVSKKEKMVASLLKILNN